MNPGPPEQRSLCVQMLHIHPPAGVIALQTFVKLIFRSKYFDFIELFVAANVINLSNPRGNAGLQWCGHEFCTKLSTKTVRCVARYLSHNCLHSYPYGVTFAFHHTSRWMADLASYRLLSARVGHRH